MKNKNKKTLIFSSVFRSEEYDVFSYDNNIGKLKQQHKVLVAYTHTYMRPVCKYSVKSMCV